MKVTQTIELTDKERLTVQNFLDLTDQISDISDRSMDDVFNRYSFSGLVQIAEI